MRDLIVPCPRPTATRIAHLAVLVAILGGLHLLLAPAGWAQDKQERPRNGGTVTPSHVPNNQLDTVWLADSLAGRGRTHRP